jgi:hypothetical protein
MKKYVLLAAVVLTAISLSSCGKSWNCECVTATNRYGYPRTTTTDVISVGGTKRKAKSSCEARSSYASSVSVRCRIK